AAFKATLEETLSATLVLHVIDAADPAADLHQQTVEDVLEQIGATALPRLKVYNKIDLVDRAPGVVRDTDGMPTQVWLSAATGHGVSALLEVIAERVSEGRIREWIELPARLQRLRAHLFDLGAILNEQVGEDGSSRLHIDLARRDARDLSRLGGHDGSWVHQHLLKY
ncbi:MAG: GTPase HflX, partial [Pseudomonadota bacterium]